MPDVHILEHLAQTLAYRGWRAGDNVALIDEVFPLETLEELEAKGGL